MPLNVFISYSHNDEPYRKELEKHLTLLNKTGLISSWSDRVIEPGKKWSKEIGQHLEEADLFICLVSPDFLASEYCYDIEMRRALELQDADKLTVVPIILRYSSWHMSPLAGLQALPTNAQPIVSWNDQDEAWLNISVAIESICRDSGHTPNRLVNPKAPRKVLSIGIFGMTGFGKSSVVNSLAGGEITRVSDITAATRSVQRVQWSLEIDQHEMIEVFDCPGLGEDPVLDEEYRKMYDDVLSKVDLAIWVQDCTSRIIAEAKRYVIGSLKPFIFGKKSLLFVVNKVDLASPQEDWDEIENIPGRSQQIFIERRITHLAGALGLPASSFVAVSALKNYNMSTLKLRILKLS